MKPRDYSETIDNLQVTRLRVASHFGMNLNHRACRIYTRTIRNMLFEMDAEERQFLADGGPEYPMERFR